MTWRRTTGLVLLTSLLAGCGSGAARPADPAPTGSPATSPAETAPTSPAETSSSPAAGPRRPDPVRTRLLFVGDLMLGRRVAQVPANAGRPVRPLRHLAPRIRDADIAVGNLESTLSDEGAPRQDPVTDSFVAPPGTLAGLDRLGFDVLSLANNHTGDFGPRAFRETLSAFRGRQVRPVGAGRDLRSARLPTVLTHHGVRFGFLAFNAIGETPAATAGSPGVVSLRMPPRTGDRVDPSDLRRLVHDVRRLARRVDVVVVLPHWGAQYTHEAVPAQSVVARALARAGADLVVGGHPHWVQGLQRIGDTVVAHSLGNAVFDMDFMEQTMEGVTLTATFRGDRLVDVTLDPYRLGADFAPRPLNGAAAAAVLADVRAHHVGDYRAP